ITETSGDGRYSESCSVRWRRRSMGVSPAAWTSLTSGSETFPSGRTGTGRHRSGQFFHTSTSRMSSGPIRYSLARCTPLGSGVTGAVRVEPEVAVAFGAGVDGVSDAGAEVALGAADDVAVPGDGSGVVTAGALGSAGVCFSASCALTIVRQQTLMAA